MEQMNYKVEIEQSRVGSLGSSDAVMVEKIGRNGISSISETDKYRLAVMLGQAERQDVKTFAMELGDRIEQEIYKIILKKFPQAVSNPLHAHEGMSKFYGFNIINHIDVEVETEDRVIWYEIKASKSPTKDVINTYSAQLQWHWMLLKKTFAHTGKKLELSLVHYNTSAEGQFDASNLSITPIADNAIIENFFYKAFIILKDYLPSFVYTAPEEMSIQLVHDDNVQAMSKFAEEAIPKIKELEKKIDEFKASLRDYMLHNNIKKITSDTYTVTLTQPSVTNTFDSKRFKTEQPEMYTRYLKQSKREASVTIHTI